MIMNLKTITFISVLLFFSPSIYSNNTTKSELEELWKNSTLKSNKIINSRFSSKLSRLEYKYYKNIYSPSIILVPNTKFSDRDDESKKKPEVISTNISYNKKLPGNSSLELNTNYLLLKDLLDADHERYMHSPTFSASYTFSLNPYWLHGVDHDPFMLSTLYQLEISKLKNIAVEKKVKESIASQYIKIRKLLRRSRYIEKRIIFTKEIIKSYKKLLEQGSIDYAQIWNNEDILMQHEDELLELNEEIGYLIMTLKTICGDEVSIETNAKMPTIDKEKKIDPELEIYKTKIKYEKAEDSIQKQSDAVHITFSADYTIKTEYAKLDDSIDVWDEKKNNEWSFSITADFSPIFNSKDKYLSRKFNISKESEYSNFRHYYNSKNKVLNHYSDLITANNKHLKESIKSYHSNLEFYEITKELNKQGSNSEVDVILAELKVIASKIKYENIEDQLWFYKWKVMEI